MVDESIETTSPTKSDWIDDEEKETTTAAVIAHFDETICGSSQTSFSQDGTEIVSDVSKTSTGNDDDDSMSIGQCDGRHLSSASASLDCEPDGISEQHMVPKGIWTITSEMVVELLRQPIKFVAFVRRNSWRGAITKSRDNIVERLTERPEKEEFTSVDFAKTLVEMVALAMSLNADWVCAAMYFKSCDYYWGTATLLILFIPIILINLFSFYWYENADHDCSTEALYFQRANKCTRPISYIFCILSHFFLMGMFYRYFMIIYFGMKTWSEERLLKQARRAKQGSSRSFATVSTVVLDDDHFTSTNTSKQDLEFATEGLTISNWQLKVAPTYTPPLPSDKPFDKLACKLKYTTNMLAPSLNAIVTSSSSRRKPENDQSSPWSASDYFDYYTMYIHQESDVAFLDLINGFLHDGSQMVLQLYIIMRPDECSCEDGHCPKDHLKLYSQYQSAVLGLISLSWCYASYTCVRRYKFEHKSKINLLGMLVQFVWRIFTLVSRVGAFALFAAGVPHGTTILLTGGAAHWLLMAGWVRAQRAHGDRVGAPGYPLTWKEFIYDMVVAYMYLFCFFNVQDGSTRVKYLVFYLLVCVENMVMLAFWFMYCTWPYRMIVLVVMIMCFFLGLLFMAIYYVFTHPNENLPNREVKARLY